MENIVTVSVLVLKEDSVLFIKTLQEDGKLKLVLPGGRLREYESIEECAARGVREAAGISIKLDEKLSGVITRRNKQGSFIVTFVFFAETSDKIQDAEGIFIPYNDVHRYMEISEFAKLIIGKLKNSSLLGMDRNEYIDGSGKPYIMYF